ncbi:MAG: glycosyltransferase family 4 protein [Firmicutes bacterium]|nr:glycosyltransferase family 4 protein [Bacillota bacterium]
MNILYDYQIFGDERYGGISKQFFSLIKFMKSKKSVNVYMPVAISKNIYVKEFIMNKTLKNDMTYFRRTIALINKMYTLIKLKNKKIDIYHPTYYNDFLLKKMKNNVLVVTLHDMIYEIYPELFPNAKKIIGRKYKHMTQADIIISVSYNTKKDILKFYPEIDPKKIRVVYQGGLINKNYDEIKNLPEKYILYVGKRSGYKNFTNLLYAFSKLAIEYQELALVCVGSKFNEDETNKIYSLELSNKIKQIRCTEKELNYLYANAFCFVYPSLYEGFGIPIVEAFENSCPVICSNTSCFPEIAGEAAIYFNPESPDSIVEAIKVLLGNPELRNDFIEKGKSRSQNYSWEKFGNNVFEIYNEFM